MPKKQVSDTEETITEASEKSGSRKILEELAAEMKKKQNTENGK